MDQNWHFGPESAQKVSLVFLIKNSHFDPFKVEISNCSHQIRNCCPKLGGMRIKLNFLDFWPKISNFSSWPCDKTGTIKNNRKGWWDFFHFFLFIFCPLERVFKRSNLYETKVSNLGGLWGALPYLKILPPKMGFITYISNLTMLTRTYKGARTYRSDGARIYDGAWESNQNWDYKNQNGHRWCIASHWRGRKAWLRVWTLQIVLMMKYFIWKFSCM